MTRFNIRTIGPEPSGATPIEPDDLDDLIPSWVASHADLNQVEFESIARALPWARASARRRGPDRVLERTYLFELHRRMFGEVWRWAGTQRRRYTNIGVAVDAIAQDVEVAFGDARYWHANETYEADEIAVRLHLRLVTIHPFPNGNGRATRLIGDLYLVSVGRPTLSWGASRLDDDGHERHQYISALQSALDDDCQALLAFARS